MKVFIVVFVALLLAGCAANRGAATAPTTGPSVAPTAISRFTQEMARERAIESTSQSRPEISGAQVPQRNLQAELMTFADAMERYFADDGVSISDPDPATLVWVVTMDGLWFNQMQVPGQPSLPPSPYRHFTVILNAETGIEMRTSARP